MALKNKLEENLRYIAFGIAFGLWFVSLLAVYLPISNWGTPTFPVTISNNVLTLFLVMSGLSSFASLYIGLDILGVISKMKKKSSTINES